MQISLTSPDFLTAFPELPDLPTPPDDHPAFRKMVRALCDVGMLAPLLVNKGRLVEVDGPLRLRAAKAAGLESVSTSEVPDEAVWSSMWHSVLARQRYTAAGLAIIAALMAEPVLAEANCRRLANLRIGAKANPNKLGSGNWTTAEDFAERAGVARASFYAARAILKKLSERPKLRDECLRKIIEGEQSLEAAGHALDGKIAGLKGETHPKGAAGQLVLDLGDTAVVRFEREIPLEERSLVQEKWCGEVAAAMPEWLAAPFEKALRTRRLGHQ